MIKSKLRAGSFLNFVVEIFSGSAFFMILRSSSGMLPGVDKHLLKGRSCNSSIHKWNGNVCSLMHNTNRSNSNTFISLCSSNRHSSGKPRPGSVILSSLPSRMPSRQDLVMRSCPAVAQSGMRWDDEMNSFDTRCQRQRGSRMSCSILQKKKQNQNLSVLFSPGNSHDVSPRQSLVTEVCSTFGFPFDPFWITPALASTLDPPPPTTTSSFNPQLCFTKSLQSAFAQAFSVTGPHHDSQEDGLHRSCNHTTLQKKKKKDICIVGTPQQLADVAPPPDIIAEHRIHNMSTPRRVAFLLIDISGGVFQATSRGMMNCGHKFVPRITPVFQLVLMARAWLDRGWGRRPSFE